MSRFHAKTWAEGNFSLTCTVLSFNSKAARAAFRSCSAQRYEFINHAAKESLLRDGYKQWLMLWDAADPTTFVPVQ